MAYLSLAQVLVLALAIAGSYGISDDVQVFEAGHKYTYSYEAVMYTGVSYPDSKQYAGSALKGTLSVYNDNGEVVFKLTDVKRGTVKQAMLGLDEEVNVHYDDERPSDTFDKLMEQPILVKFEKGLITSTKHHPSEDIPSESVHWKKAIASLFQGDFQLVVNQPNEPMEYTNEEDGIGGLCFTSYSGKVNSSTNNLHLQKTRHYDRCSRRPHYFFSSMSGNRCSDSTKGIYEAEGTVDYVLKKGSGNSLKVLDITGKGKIALSPFGKQLQIINSVVDQRLVLKKVEFASPDPRPQSINFIESTSLSFTSHHDKRNKNVKRIHLKDAHYFNRYMGEERPDRLLEAEKHFPSGDESEKQQYLQLLKLIRIFQTFSVNDFEEFFKKNIDVTPPNYYKRQVALGILPFVGTNPAILHLIKQIEFNEFEHVDIAAHISNIPFHLKEPSREMVHVLWKSLHEDRIIESENLFTTSWLAFGTVLYRGCVKDDFTPHSTNLETYMSLNTCTEYLQKMIKTFHDEEIPERKLLFLRAIKNTHLQTEQMEDFLNETLKGNYPTILRREALITVLDFYSSWQNTKEDHVSDNKLYRLSEEIFLDTSEDHAVRMAAFEVIAKAVSSQQQAKKIVLQYLVEEKNQKVAGFMYSTLAYLANSSTPCNRKFASLYGDAMNSVPPITVDPMIQGFNTYDTSFNEHFNYGHTSQIEMIASKASIIPVGLYYKESMNLMGYNVENLEIGNFAEDTSFLRDLLLVSLGKNLFGKPVPNFKPWKHLNNVEEPNVADPEAESYLSMFNQDVLTIYWRRLLAPRGRIEQLSHVTEEVNYVQQYVYRVTLRLNLNYKEVEYGVPNELGIPVVMSTLVPSQTASEAAVKTYFYSAGIRLKVTVSYFTGVLATMEVKSRYNLHGFRQNTLETVHLPIDTYINLRQGNAKLLPTESFELVTYQTMPETFNDKDTAEIGDDEMIKEKTQFGHDYFGVGATVDLTFHPQWMAQSLQLINEITTIKDVGAFSEAVHSWYTFFLLNPTQRPMSFSVRIGPSLKNPTKAFVFSLLDIQGRTLQDFKAALRITGDGPIPREWGVDFALSSEKLSTKKTAGMSLQFKRGPLPNYDANRLAVCLSFDATIEKMSQVFLEPSSWILFPKLLFNTKLTHGQSCSSPNATVYKVKGFGQVSLQKKIAVIARVIDDKCLFNLNTEDIEYCLIETARSGKLNEFSADVEYQNIHKNTIYEGTCGWIRQLFDSRLDQDEDLFAAPIEDGKVRLTAYHSYDAGAIDLSVVRPNNATTSTTIRLPENELNEIDDFQATDGVGRFRTGFFDSTLATCYFSADEFDTFDEVRYHYELDDQDYYVVMTHCPSQNFAIRIRKTRKNETEMMINVGVLRIIIAPLLGKVILADESGPQQQWNRYHISGILGIQEECTSTLCTIRQSRGEGGVLVSVQKTDDTNGYYIKSEPFMVNIFFNGKVGIISASNFYKGHQCGLCGNFDGEQVDEFVGSDGKLYKSAEEFVRSYASGA